MPGRPPPQIDDELLREALDGLFEIAREDNPPEVTASIRAQLEELPREQLELLLREMVDTDRLRTHLEDIGRGKRFDAEIPAFEEPQMEKVDRVLHPLARMATGDEGVRSLHELGPEQRAHLLLDAVGRR